MDLHQFALQFLNGLAYSMLLFLLAAGLTIIFGMMDFMNLAHGSFYMVGAYLALTVTQRFDNFWLAILVVPLVVGLMALALERTMLQRVFQRGHLDQVLLTFGLALMIADLVKFIWGADIRSVPAPDVLKVPVTAFTITYPGYRLFVIVAGLALAGVLWYVQQRTRLGSIVRAGVDDKEMVRALGINISRVSALVFAGGAGLAALAGVIAGPYLSLQPGMDFDTLIPSLIVVVIGGLGTLRGSFFGALLVGIADTVGKVYSPDYSLMVIYAIMAVVLLARPSGLFGRATT